VPRPAVPSLLQSLSLNGDANPVPQESLLQRRRIRAARSRRYSPTPNAVGPTTLTQMAGTPVRRRRREQREARQRGNRRFDDLAREAVLERAEEVGPTVAAREVGISPGTIRTWRKRRADAVPVAVPEIVSEDTPTTPAGRLRA
jgi:hypothetical protein